jgi:S-DNA-T family DNA segregation ATPase FtsK/SpoIIIE
MANIFSLVSKKNEAIQSIQKFEDDEVRFNKIIADLKQLYPQEYKSKQIELENTIDKIQDELAHRISMVLTYIQSLQESIDGTFLDELVDALVDSSRLISGSHLLLDRLLVIVDGEKKLLTTPSRQVSRSWDDERWWEDDISNKYIPRTEGLAPILLRSGTLREIRSIHSGFSLPLDVWAKKESVQQLFVENSININLAELPLLLQSRTFKQGEDSGHIAIFTNSPETRQAATAALESIALRAMATFPARKLQGIFIDPVSMGNTFPFKSLPEEIRGKRTYTTSDDIQEQLHKLIGHTEQVIQNYLSRDYDNIEAYNAAAEAIQEAYRYLFIADFPSKFDNKSFEFLNSLLVNGSRAGVYTIIHIDETLEKPRNFNYDLFKAHCQILRPADRSYNGEPLFVYESPEAQIVLYATLDKPPESDRFNQLTAMISKASGEVKVDTVAFSQLYPETLWTGDSRGEIRTAIGVAGAREKLEFWLGQNPKGLEVSQSLLFGKPGAGKSYTLHSIINGLAMRYAPDELELYLLDFKEGVEFQVYVDPDRGEDSGSSTDLDLTKALPHAKVISIESDREFGLSVLRKVNEQFQIRANEWKSVSNDITKVAEYRNKTNGKKMPRILIVIDEFQVLFEDNDSISAELNQIFDTIVKKGRAFGIHLLLASQSPNIKNITRGVYDLIDLRMAMQMNQNVAAMTLAEGNTDAVDLLDRPGRIIYNSDFGRKGSNEIGQIADASTDQRKKALRKIQETVQANGYQRPPTDQLVVFDGRHPTRLQNNGLLTVLATANKFLPIADIKDVISESNWRVREYPSVAWVGEAMQIGYHSRAIFRRRSRSNMLLVGNAEESIFGILGGVLTSLACCHQPKKAQFHIIDLSDEEDRGSHWWTMTLFFRQFFYHFFPITIAKDFPNSDRKIVKASTTIQNIHAEFERRKQLREADPDTTNFGASIFFVAAIGTLERLNSLRPTVDNRGNPDMSDDAKKILAIAAQGAELGIHLILWVEGIKTFNQLFAGKERISLSHFDLRIGLTMPADDSRTLFNETLAASLTKLRAYFKDEATAANLEKFKPYAVPTQQEFATYANYLKQKR